MATTREGRIFAPDNLGSGNSDPLPPNAQIADLARSMIHFMDRPGIERAHVFGFHTNNKIATEMAAAWPARVDRLILCGHTPSIMAENEALNVALKAPVGPSIRTFEPAPDGSHLLKQWAADFGVLASTWWDTSSFARETLTPEFFERRRQRVVDHPRWPHLKRNTWAARGRSWSGSSPTAGLARWSTTQAGWRSRRRPRSSGV